MERIILHCDLNNFFASVSLLYNQTLYNLPVAVCGDKEQRHGIILAKNEIAKGYGVKTAEAIWEAKNKCPDLVLLPPVYDKYEEFSKRAQEIYLRYTDMIEPFGIDECWLDVTGSTMLFGSGEEIANRIRNEIKNELGITISVGVSFNKVFAKLGSDMKKPDATTVITRENFKQKVWPLPVGDLLFVGSKTLQKLNSNGMFTIGDVALCDKDVLVRLFGKNGADLHRAASGEDTSPVKDVHHIGKPKSIGRSVTGANDFNNNDEVWQTFITLAEDVSYRLRKHSLYAGGVQIHLRDSLLNTREIAHSLDTPTDISLNIARAAMDIFKTHYGWEKPLRSVGLRAINLKSDLSAIQQSLFSDEVKLENLEKIEDSIHSIRKKFGDESIKRARTIK